MVKAIVGANWGGCCAKHQRDITTAVKRARHIAILPYAQQ